MRKKARWLCVVLAVTMALQTAGCGGAPANQDPGQSISSMEQSAESSRDEEKQGGEASSSQAEASGEETGQVETVVKITDNGEKIADFYDFVNAQWMQEEQKKDSNFSGYLASGEKMMMDRIEKMLDEANLDEMDPADDFYKVVSYYRQLTDEESRKNYDNKKIKKYLDKIDGVKSLKDLYALYADPDYVGCTHLFYFRLNGDVYESGTIFVQPKTAMGGYHDINATNTAGLLKMLKIVGYSDKRAEEIVKNAHEIDGYILAVGGEKAWGSKVDYISQETVESEGIQFPVLQIFNELQYLDENQVVKASQNIIPFWEKVYVPENLRKLKDHMLLSALNELACFGNSELFDAYEKAAYLSDTPLGTSKKKIIMDLVCSLVGDAIADQYCKTYLDEKVIPNAEEWGKKICAEMKRDIEEMDWLTIDGEGYLKDKVLYLKPSYGRNRLAFSLENVTLGDDLLENSLRIHKAGMEFAKKRMWELKKSRSTKGAMAQVNAFYDGTVNGFVVCDGLLSLDYCSPDAAYEEQLASIGITLAHELGHAFDPNFINIDYEGYGYYDWMADREEKAYQDIVDQLIAFYDGRTVDAKRVISGKDICSETFADLTAMNICLRILEKKEDADYDLFFQTYARMNASRNNIFQLLGMKSGDYLPPKERVNLIVGMFDEFYETYDIDEGSPNYIPKEERIKGF